MSAALFGHFYRSALHPSAQIFVHGLQHRRGDPFSDVVLDGDDNACVDFRYCPSEKMTWWFDHHVSAFQPPSLKAHFDADRSGQKFFDPTAQSCAVFQARVLRDSFGFQLDRDECWSELLGWADIIDGARFHNATEAVELRHPALQIMTWLENNGNAELTRRLISHLGRRPLAEIAVEPWLSEPLVPILERHKQTIDIIRERAVFDAGVVYFDLTDDGVASPNKFIAYMLFPEATYTVGVTTSSERAKVSVGCNPWASERCEHNIARICERYGGGGHPVVGGVTLPASQVDRAREIAGYIRSELMGASR